MRKTMRQMVTLSRRGALAGCLGAAGGVFLFGSAPAAAQETGGKQAASQNGWPVIQQAPLVPIEGSELTVALLDGDVATVLLHCVRRFCYELDGPWAPGDVVGHRADARVDAEYESNHLSGTAVTIRPSWYPLGVGGGFFEHELVVVRDVLADCEGVVRWGGDLRPVKESHFQIDVPPGDPRLRAVAEKIAAWNHSPGAGAGSTVDPFCEERRAVARLIERRQRG